MSTTALVWLRRDLRLADNPALAAACQRYQRVLPVFIWAPEEEAPWQPGGASRWWLHHSLAALQKSLPALRLRAGDSLAELRKLIAETGATAVYWNRLYEPALIARDKGIKETLRAEGLDAESFNAALLFEPWEMKTLAAGEPYRVFTPFYKAMLPRLPARALHIADVGRVPTRQQDWPKSLPLESLELLPKINWDAAFYQHWTPGEAGARARLEEFCKHDVTRYQDDRDLPAEAATSRLSPHLHFGEISPVQIHARVQRLMAENSAPGVLKNAQGFIREVVWREFSHHLLYHFPKTPQEPLYAKFAPFPWRRGYTKDLRAWQQGRTGIPIVDAGMRELWVSGIMHNRVRMIVASLLTKNLLIPWQEGAQWFWDTLVDADLAQNTLGWQWTAGCGADAAPYFRVFNPILQARKFDPDGVYIKRWVPELAGLSGDELFAPWESPNPSKNYPAPIVDLAASRDRALAAYAEIKGANG